MWAQPAMARRSLTSPAVQGDYAVVGDFDGYLHWLKLDTGELAARTRFPRDALRAAPTVLDSILVAEGTDRGISAYRVETDRERGAKENLPQHRTRNGLTPTYLPLSIRSNHGNPIHRTV